MPDQTKTNFVITEQVRKLYSESSTGQIASLVNSLILAFILWPVSSHLLIGVWLATLIAVMLGRRILQMRFNRWASSLTLSETVTYKNLFVAALGITGMVWGAAGVVLFPADSVMHQAFIAYVLGGMVAGAVGLYAIRLSAFVAYSLPAALPLAFMFFRIQDEIHVAMGAMVLLFLLLMWVSAKRHHKTLLKFLNLKFENSELVSDLQDEICERKRAEAELQKRKEEIEGQVEQRTAELQHAVETLNAEIDKRRQTEAALRENEEKYRELVENINDVIYAVDVDGVITYISPALEAMVGYTPDEVVGRNLTEFVYAEDLAIVLARFQKLLSGRIMPSEYRLVTKTGEVRWVRNSGRPVTKAGRTIGMRGILSDITANKNLEARLQQTVKMDAIGVLAGGVAHDLNNILSGLVSYPDLLLMDLSEDSPLKGPLQAIKKSGQRAAGIVQDLLTLGRRGVIAKNTISLNDVVNEYWESPEFDTLKADHPRIRFKADLVEDSMSVSGSFVHLAKVLMNLVTNAVDAMPAGGELTIATFNRLVDTTHTGYESVEPGEYAVLRVADTGVGISVQDQKRIYEPYYTKKADGQTGTGLGMAVVWGTVKDHSGFIELQSREGEGTCIDLFFPVSREKGAPVEEKSPTASYAGKNEAILIVDDEAGQRAICSQILQRLGYRVTTAAGGEEAVRLAGENRFDLLILDMIMEPGIDGLETYRRIIDIHPGQKAVIVSGFSETERVKEARRLGVGDYLRKPYTLEGLGTMVRRLLDGD